MLELKTSYSFSQIPYITYDALGAYAEAVIRDAMPETLRSPFAVDTEWFVEFYLGLQIEFKRLSYDRQILGMTAFNSGYVQVMDEVSGRTSAMPVEAGTVIIEPILAEKRNTTRRRFTYMHEGAHWLLQRKAFAADNPYGGMGKYENQYLAAKEGHIDYSRSMRENSDNERMERQADFLASAMLMPKATLRMAFRNFFQYYGETPRKLIRGINAFDDCLALQLPEYVAKIFNVSKRAALIRLEKLKAITNV